MIRRWAPGREAAATTDEVRRLLTDYHLSTEAEKGAPVAAAAQLPPKYRAEIDDPAGSFGHDAVLLAFGDDGSAVGVVVATGLGAQTDAAARGPESPGSGNVGAGDVGAGDVGTGDVGTVDAGTRDARAGDADPRWSEVKRLWVDPSRRGRGLATGLLQAAVTEAGRAGADGVRLSVWDWRRNAIAVYERLGFVEVESWDPRANLVCMQRPTHPFPAGEADAHAG